MSDDIASPTLWADPWWRLTNLYSIVTDDAQEIRFKPNEEQREFYERLHYRNLILKARQLGFTTFVDILALDQCLFNRNFRAVIIAHTLPDAQRIFREKVMGVYRRLPAFVRDMVHIVKESADELVFSNGSSIAVSTSARGGTTQFLHVSEMGKIARKFPDKAREIVTGAFESVPKDGIIVVESTAEGAAGWFYDNCQEAMRRRQQGSIDTQIDFRLHFFPWYRKAAYELDTLGVIFTDSDRDYFAKLELLIGKPITPQQRAWYVKKRVTMGDDMKREYPSSEDEAFAQSVEGVIYGRDMQMLRELGRIGRVPYREKIVVNTFWDLGLNDENTIWLHQRVGAMNRFLRYFHGANEGMRFYYDKLEEWRAENKATWGKHYLPHDGDQRIQGYEVTTRKEILEDCGLRDIVVVPRIDDVRTGVDLVKRLLPECEFDEEACADGIKCLDHYSREWDEKRGTWSSRPRHDWASNGADSFRQFAQAFNPDEGARGLAFNAPVTYGRGGY